jgi:hypothetical protein
VSNADLVTLIEKSEEICCSAILRMQERQTIGEQVRGTTSESNGRGWNAQHAPFMSSLARQIVENRGKRELGVLPEGRGLLSPKQLEAARRILPVYIKQLQAIVDEKNRCPGKTAVAPQVEEPCLEPELDTTLDDNPIPDPSGVRLALPPPGGRVPEDYDDGPLRGPLGSALSEGTSSQGVRIERAKAEGDRYTWRVAGPETWEVQSASGKFYTVTLSACTCPDHTENLAPIGSPVRCKHRIALETRLIAEAERTGKPVVLRVLPPANAQDAAFDNAFGRLEYVYHPASALPRPKRSRAKAA